VNGARGTRLTKKAGRDKRGLMLAINRDQRCWQLFILTGMEQGPGWPKTFLCRHKN
jgi:hypothetical protein